MTYGLIPSRKLMRFFQSKSSFKKSGVCRISLHHRHSGDFTRQYSQIENSLNGTIRDEHAPVYHESKIFPDCLAFMRVGLRKCLSVHIASVRSTLDRFQPLITACVIDESSLCPRKHSYAIRNRLNIAVRVRFGCATMKVE